MTNSDANNIFGFVGSVEPQEVIYSDWGVVSTGDSRTHVKHWSLHDLLVAACEIRKLV